jgi:hypothetical protein
VIDFIFHNLQPLKDRLYLVFLYVGVKDLTHESKRVISEEEILIHANMMLKGDIYNEGPPQAYSAWYPFSVVSISLTS